MDKLISITATNGKRDRHIGSYAIPEVANRVIKFIEDFAGIGWRVKDVIETNRKGIYHVRPTRPTNCTSDSTTRNR